MCGILGIYSSTPVVSEMIAGLGILQHRGQEAAGITLGNSASMETYKAVGMVRDVFNSTCPLIHNKGHIGIGHVRYPTWGSLSGSQAQPLTVNVPYGISLAHNGQLVNADEVRAWVAEECHRYLTTDSDSELILNTLAHFLYQKNVPMAALNQDVIFDSIKQTMAKCRGAYAIVGLVVGAGLIGFRDPLGIRPMVIGKRQSQDKTTEYMLASESSVLSVMGFDLFRDVKPGEMVFIDNEGTMHTKDSGFADGRVRHCIFEYIYLSRPDSHINGISVYAARREMGRALGEGIKQKWRGVDIDVVIPIPECSNIAAAEVANVLEAPYREAFVKNRYSGRTFIVPQLEQRQQIIRRKYNPIPEEFTGKSVLLVDDSIVRGATSKRLVDVARAQGAKKIYFASAAPPVRFQNIFGIDVPTRQELIAYERELHEIQAELGCDGLIYISVEDMVSAVRCCLDTVNIDFDLSMFNGEYYFDEVSHLALAEHEATRADGLMLTAPPTH